MPDQTKKHFLAEAEEKLIALWQKEKTFEKSLARRSKAERFNFYDGPPFANGIPHYGHLEQATIKDTITRYKTMRGYFVPRKVGWDTHGLPIEYAMEKKLGFKSKKDILNYGIDKFNKECRDSVYIYKDVWEKMYRRIGRWADYEHAYSTLDSDYIESVWWAFKSIHDRGLVYKDFRSSPYCPRCATPLSNFELNQGYQDGVDDPSLFVKFKLTDQDAYMVAWTTTPWSLPGNVGLAVKPDAQYVYIKLNQDDGQSQTVIIARERMVEISSESYQIVKEVKGADLVGLSYEPVFKLSNLDQYEGRNKLYKVWGASFVSIKDGTGIVHVAPATGEDDLLLAKQHGLPVLFTIDENGQIADGFGLSPDIVGKFFKKADDIVIEELTKAGKVFAAERIKHTYPFCWRCDTPLFYYATDSWAIKVTEIKKQLVANNAQINWTPDYIRDGRFGNWLEGARDWAVSRNRFWGAPLPIWVTEDGEVLVIGSLEELKQRAVNKSKIDENDLHRPYIDEIVLKTDSGKEAHRISEVFDVWFESGSMPYAQDHYPFTDKAGFEKHFPADFIAEAIDQTRGWFYTLHVIATAIFDEPAFQNVICSGWIVAADGEKLSKRKKNYAPMDQVFDEYGVDTLRFFIASSPLMNGEDSRFSTDYLRDVQRKIFMSLNNSFSFFELYSKVDGWKPSKKLSEPVSDNILDEWMMTRLNQTIAEVTDHLDGYRLDKATKPIADLIDDLSNWYVRRSRRRFWKSQNDSDKDQAYSTLYYSIVRICQLLCPFAPFLADEIWRKLVKETDLPQSVHLSDWPKPGDVNELVLEKMAAVRLAITEGLSERATKAIKVRQPLAKVTISYQGKLVLDEEEPYKQLIRDELNVLEVEFKKASKAQTNDLKVVLDVKLTPGLIQEGLAREVIRNVQSARKAAGLNVDDRIKLALKSPDSILNTAIKNFSDIILRETLAKSITEEQSDSLYESEAKIDGYQLSISVAKV
ncbi:MAG TPA: isoleucine--tRNA ligase [Candidatus Saccharimonadales bacterium]|nr:isoleucine--tRNA ligase [Candidatus Saccharimonadales bacterium]